MTGPVGAPSPHPGRGTHPPAHRPPAFPPPRRPPGAPGRWCRRCKIGRARPVPVGHVPPRGAGVEPPAHPVEDGPVVGPLTARRGDRGGKKSDSNAHSASERSCLLMPSRRVSQAARSVRPNLVHPGRLAVPASVLPPRNQLTHRRLLLSRVIHTGDAGVKLRSEPEFRPQLEFWLGQSVTASRSKRGSKWICCSLCRTPPSSRSSRRGRRRSETPPSESQDRQRSTSPS